MSYPNGSRKFCKKILLVKNWGIVQIRMDQRGYNMKKNFEYFQIQNEFDKWNWVICLNFMFPFRFMVVKKVHFCNFLVNVIVFFLVIFISFFLQIVLQFFKLIIYLIKSSENTPIWLRFVANILWWNCR